jgi:hypothetical protein
MIGHLFLVFEVVEYADIAVTFRERPERWLLLSVVYE